jgi:G6PDH family F420-dependent oxidoreductase
MLIEAVKIMRSLWSGETVDFHGEFYTVENARLFTTPPQPIQIVWAASGESSAEAAARFADGLWSTQPNAEVVAAYRDAGGHGPTYGQVTMCYGNDRDEAIATALRQWPTAGIPGQLTRDLPTWTHFEQTAELVTEERIAERIPCGPDVRTIADRVAAYVDAGFDHIHFHQVGTRQAEFIQFWVEDLQPVLDQEMYTTSGLRTEP